MKESGEESCAMLLVYYQLEEEEAMSIITTGKPAHSAYTHDYHLR